MNNYDDLLKKVGKNNNCTTQTNNDNREYSDHINLEYKNSNLT